MTISFQYDEISDILFGMNDVLLSIMNEHYLNVKFVEQFQKTLLIKKITSVNNMRMSPIQHHNEMVNYNFRKHQGGSSLTVCARLTVCLSPH